MLRLYQGRARARTQERRIARMPRASPPSPPSFLRPSFPPTSSVCESSHECAQMCVAALLPIDKKYTALHALAGHLTLCPILLWEKHKEPIERRLMASVATTPPPLFFLLLLFLAFKIEFIFSSPFPPSCDQTFQRQFGCFDKSLQTGVNVFRLKSHFCEVE